MSAATSTPGGAAPAHAAVPPPGSGRALRQRRAQTARRLLMGSAEACAVLDWDLLDAAPDWLAWPEADAAVFQRRVGALACAASIRLWIDAARLAALRSALGDAYLQALLAAPAAPALPNDGLGGPRIDGAAQVAPMLRAAGIAVLLAAVPTGPLRSAVAAVMAPAIPSAMALPLAESLVAQSLALAARAKQSDKKELQ